MLSDTPISLCTHLTVPSPDAYVVWFTGRGAEYHWVCCECAKQHPALPNSRVVATDALIENCEREATWEGICGSPEFERRLTTLHFEHRELERLPFRERWIDAQPDPRSNHWLVLLSCGSVGILRPDECQLEIAFRLSELEFSPDEETSLCVSDSKDYAAIFQASGRHACAFDLNSGQITARIDRGEYRPENSHFPIAFFESDGQTLLAVSTGWNRLDVVDPASGKVLTDRTLPMRERDKPRPEHYLDYFHARLAVSPDNAWIADCGWHWHPYGVVRSWSLRDWLRNPWESEDGPSLRCLAARNYYWDGPLCWIDNSTVAIWGWGDDDEWLIPAAHLFDISTGKEIRWFPGPEARRPNAWPPKKQPPSLFFDKYLFSVGVGKGISVWDVDTGERLHLDPNFEPVHYHSTAKEFLSLTPTGIRLSKLKD